MKKINLDDLRSANYDTNEWNSESPCLICGKDVSKTEDKLVKNWSAICKKEPKAVKWYKDNYLHMSTDGNLYFVDEDVASGEESQGCFAVGCDCMRKYKELRASEL